MSRPYTPHITDAQQVLSDDEIMALMPDNFVFIAQLIDVSHALALIEAYGGTDLFIPKRHAIALKHPIADIIGYQRLNQLAEQLGNTTIEIPQAKEITQQMRNRIIRQAAKTESKSKLARKYSLTKRWIRAIVNSPDEIKSKRDDRQQDLFGTE